MTDAREQRRLAAILAADVVGYSRLMGVDEAGTLAALRVRWKDVLTPCVARHRGRVVKVMGDGVLVEFGSAVDAVECAVALQAGFAGANEGVAEDRRIVLRIGINLGDVIVQGGDLYGDGVNIAARLEALAEPGGICVSASIHDQVRGKVAVRFDATGPQVLKNIADPVQVFHVCSDAAPAALPLGMDPRPLPLPTQHSIAVLPFVNMSADPEYEFFVDGLTEDLITDLSRHPGLFVIARNSTFAYKGKPMDMRRIARELGVRYLLEGSARRAGGRLRINVQLIDSIGGGHLWAERFDRQLEDIFDLQDEVTARIREALVGQLVAPPARKRTHSVAAYDLCVRGRALFDFALGSQGAMREAMLLLESAIDIDPNFAEPYRCLAETRALAWIGCGIPVDTRRGTVLEIAERAVVLDPADSNAYSTFAFVLEISGQWDASRRAHHRALELGPSNATALMAYAEFLNFAGRPGDAEVHMRRALRLNPNPPAWYYTDFGKVQYSLRQYSEAAKTLRHPATYRTGSRRYLAASLAQAGLIDEARQEAALFMANNPTFTIAHWVGSMQFQDTPTLAHFVEGFRKAGLPG